MKSSCFLRAGQAGFAAVFAMLAMLSALLSGCGGSSGGADESPAATVSLSGTAATGAAVSGVVHVVDKNGNRASANIGTGGSYTVGVGGMTAPFLVKVVRNGGGEALYSFANAAGITANATPLTTLALFLAHNQGDLAALFDAWAANHAALTLGAIHRAQAAVNANFSSRLQGAGLDPADYDFFETPFVVNRIGIDAVLDDLRISFSTGPGGTRTATITNAAGASVAFNVNIDTSGITVAGLRQARQLTVATLVRDFVVYVPKSARGTRAPVVFMLHGTSGDGPQFYNISGWRQKADAEGLITVFPSALTHCFYEDENRNGIFEEPSPPTAEGPTFEKKVTTKWAHGALGVASEMPLCTGAQIDALDNDAKEALVRHPLADDVAFFDAMLDFLAANYPIDAKRVHVSGFSNGGQMAARLAMERSQRFAAATSNAGPLQVSSVATRPISMIYAVGSMDDRYLPDPACLTVVPRAPSCITELPMDATILQSAAIQGQIDGYLNALRLANTYTFSEGWGECDATGSCTVRATQAQCVNAADCRKLAKFAYTTSTVGANNQFHFILIESATHQYPNGTNHELIMADYFWEDFFKNLALP